MDEAALCERFRRMAWRLALAAKRSRTLPAWVDPEDAVQECFARLLEYGAGVPEAGAERYVQAMLRRHLNAFAARERKRGLAPRRDRAAPPGVVGLAADRPAAAGSPVYWPAAVWDGLYAALPGGRRAVDRLAGLTPGFASYADRAAIAAAVAADPGLVPDR